MENNLWDLYRKINHELLKEFLCVPPYPLNGSFIAECGKNINDKKKLRSQIGGRD